MSHLDYIVTPPWGVHVDFIKYLNKFFFKILSKVYWRRPMENYLPLIRGGQLLTFSAVVPSNRLENVI